MQINEGKLWSLNKTAWTNKAKTQMKGGVGGTNNERLGLKTSSGVVEVCDAALNRDAVRGNFGTDSECQSIHPLRCVKYHKM